MSSSWEGRADSDVAKARPSQVIGRFEIFDCDSSSNEGSPGKQLGTPSQPHPAGGESESLTSMSSPSIAEVVDFFSAAKGEAAASKLGRSVSVGTGQQQQRERTLCDITNVQSVSRTLSTPTKVIRVGRFEITEFCSPSSEERNVSIDFTEHGSFILSPKKLKKATNTTTTAATTTTTAAATLSTTITAPTITTRTPVDTIPPTCTSFHPPSMSVASLGSPSLHSLSHFFASPAPTPVTTPCGPVPVHKVDPAEFTLDENMFLLSPLQASVQSAKLQTPLPPKASHACRSSSAPSTVQDVVEALQRENQALRRDKELLMAELAALKRQL